MKFKKLRKWKCQMWPVDQSTSLDCFVMGGISRQIEYETCM